MRSVFPRAARIWISNEHKLQPQRFTSHDEMAECDLQAEPSCTPQAQFCLQEGIESCGSRVWGPGAVWFTHTGLCLAHPGALLWEEALWAYLIFLGDCSSPLSTVCHTQEFLLPEAGPCLCDPASKMSSFHPQMTMPTQWHNQGHHLHKKAAETLVQSGEKVITYKLSFLLGIISNCSNTPKSSPYYFHFLFPHCACQPEPRTHTHYLIYYLWSENNSYTFHLPIYVVKQLFDYSQLFPCSRNSGTLLVVLPAQKNHLDYGKALLACSETQTLGVIHQPQ